MHQTQLWTRHKVIYLRWFGPNLVLSVRHSGFNWCFYFAPVFQWCYLMPQKSPGVTIPSGYLVAKLRRINVDATWSRRIDVNTTSFLRHVPAGYVASVESLSVIPLGLNRDLFVFCDSPLMG